MQLGYETHWCEHHTPHYGCALGYRMYLPGSVLSIISFLNEPLIEFVLGAVTSYHGLIACRFFLGLAEGMQHA